ncbi:hypothetical protein [Streptomyces sp. NPDC017964]|uniref:hypothetical protein n=1 Tax=Streptomyces sp. NPDC017964 TaxID=3365022 RepID=UPI0037B72C73
MAERPARTYLVTNPTALFGPRRIVFHSSAPAGSVVRVDIDGRPFRALLTSDAQNGGLLAAELQITYL